MNRSAFAHTLTWMIVLSSLQNAVAEIHLSEHELLNNIGKQLPIMKVDFNISDKNSNDVIGNQTHYQTDFDFTPTRFDYHQLSAICDYYLTSTLLYSGHLSEIINTSIEVNQYTQYPDSGSNHQQINQYQRPASSLDDLLNDHFLIQYYAATTLDD